MTLIAYIPSRDPRASGPFSSSFRKFLTVILAMELDFALGQGLDLETFWASQRSFNILATFEPLLPCRAEVEAMVGLIRRALPKQSSPHLLPTETMRQLMLNGVEPFQVEFNAIYRQLFLSDSGHLGLAPELSKAGDVLCFLQGTKVPFLCRMVGNNRYTLIGEVYVHGLMHGEVASAKGSVQDIILE